MYPGTLGMNQNPVCLVIISMTPRIWSLTFGAILNQEKTIKPLISNYYYYDHDYYYYY